MHATYIELAVVAIIAAAAAAAITAYVMTKHQARDLERDPTTAQAAADARAARQNTEAILEAVRSEDRKRIAALKARLSVYRSIVGAAGDDDPDSTGPQPAPWLHPVK